MDQKPEAMPDEPGSSEALVRRAREGDSVAWLALHDRYARRLLALAHYLVRRSATSRDSAEDLVQEVWSGFVAEIGTFRYEGPGSPFQLLATMLRRRSLDATRRAAVRARERTNVRDVAVTRARARAADPPSLPSRLADRQVSLTTCLLDPRLPRRYAEILVAIYLEEVDPEALAKTHDLAPPALRQLLQRARARFRDLSSAAIEDLV